MKKWFDRLFIGKLSIQLIAVFLVICVISVFSGILLNVSSDHTAFSDNFFIQSLKGFFQLVDNEEAKETLNSFDDIRKKTPEQAIYIPLMILISLFVWMIGTVLFSFITAAFANAFDNRNRLIAMGAVRYKFSGRHGIVIGWNFTAIALVKNLLLQHNAKEIVILSALPPEQIRNELRQNFSRQELKNIYVYQGDCFSQTDIDSLCAWNAGTIFITGHGKTGFDCNNNGQIYALVEKSIDKKIGHWSDYQRFATHFPVKHPFIFKCISYKLNNKILLAFTAVRSLVKPYFFQESFLELFFRYGKKIYYPRTPVKIFPDVPDTLSFPGLFNPQNTGHIVTYPYNYCSASFRELYCSLPQIEKKNAFFQYTPLAFRRKAKNNVHLLISGFNDMAQTVISESLRIIPENTKCKITVFLPDEEEVRSFEEFVQYYKNAEFNLIRYGICHPEAENALTQAIQDDNTSTTLFITGQKNNDVLQTFSSLTEKIRYWNIRVVLEQRAMSKMVLPLDRIREKGIPPVNYLGLFDGFCTTLDQQMETIKKCFILQNKFYENEVPDRIFLDRRYHEKRKSAETFALSIPEKLYQCNYNVRNTDLLRYIPENIHIPTGTFKNITGILPSPENIELDSLEKNIIFQNGIIEKLRNCGAICGFIEDKLSREIMAIACSLAVPVIGLSKQSREELLENTEYRSLLHNLQYFFKVDQKCAEETLIINHCDRLLSANNINFDKFIADYFNTDNKEFVSHPELDEIIPAGKAKKVCFILREKFFSNSGSRYDDWLESFPLCEAGESKNEPEPFKNERDYQNYACARIGHMFAVCEKYKEALVYYGKTDPERCNSVEKAILILWLLQCENLSGENSSNIKNAVDEMFKKFTFPGENPDKKAICNSAIRILRKYESTALFREFLLQLYEAKAHLYFNLGNSLSFIKTALKSHKKVLSERVKKYGLHHKKTSKSHLNIAQCYIKLKRYSYAQTILEYALKFRSRMFGQDSLEVAYAEYFLAQTLMLTEKYEDAEKFASEALKISENCLGKDHAKTKLARKLYNDIKSKSESKKSV